MKSQLCSAQVQWLAVASLAEAWIEMALISPSPTCAKSPPSRRRGLKLVVGAMSLRLPRSPPSRRRGLKSWDKTLSNVGTVASLAEAWIEM